MPGDAAPDTPATAAEDAADLPAGTLTAEADTDTLTAVLDALAAAHEEAIAEFTADGLYAHVVDPANVLMAHVHAPPAAFAEYAAANLPVGLRLAKLRATVTAGDTARLAWDTDAWRLHVRAGPMDAHLSTVDPTSISTHGADVSTIRDGTTATWTMDASDLSTALGAADIVDTSHGRLLADPDGFTGLRVEGDTDDIDVAFDSAAFETAGEPVDVLLSTDYLTSLEKPIPTDATVTMHAAPEHPVVFEYDTEGVACSLMVAPRIERQ